MLACESLLVPSSLATATGALILPITFNWEMARTVMQLMILSLCLAELFTALPRVIFLITEPMGHSG